MLPTSYVVFVGSRCLCRGDWPTILAATKQYLLSAPIQDTQIPADPRAHISTNPSTDTPTHAPTDTPTKTPTKTLLIFDEKTGKQVEFAWDDAAQADGVRVDPNAEGTAEVSQKGTRGRPKLGVVSREVSLLPAHWEWLEQQSGGASVALRKLVEQARKQDPQQEQARLSRESLSRILTSLAGDLPHYEEILRALYAKKSASSVYPMLQQWPTEICTYMMMRWREIDQLSQRWQGNGVRLQPIADTDPSIERFAIYRVDDTKNSASIGTSIGICTLQKIPQPAMSVDLSADMLADVDTYFYDVLYTDIHTMLTSYQAAVGDVARDGGGHIDGASISVLVHPSNIHMHTWAQKRGLMYRYVYMQNADTRADTRADTQRAWCVYG